MRRLFAPACLAALCLLGIAGPLQAQPIKIKLATLAPEGSAWEELLKDLQADWTRISGGKVELRIFPGGVAGDETVVMQKMGINNYQAALISSHGLSTIDKSVRTFTIPRILRTNDELEKALDIMAPELEKRLEAKGYEVLFWADAGWVKFFVQSPDPTIEGVRKHRFFSWAGDQEGLELWKKAGFDVVPLPATELVTSLQTKMVNAFDVVPYYAVATQSYKHVQYMIDMNWAPLPGALIITKAAWDKIPDDLKPALREVSAKYTARFRTETRKMEADAVEAMKARGLQVVTPTPEVVAQWDQALEKAYPDIRGYYVSAEDFDWLTSVAKKVRSEP
jgi:TRAP-type transport system periplasmic protein